VQLLQHQRELTSLRVVQRWQHITTQCVVVEAEQQQMVRRMVDSIFANILIREQYEQQIAQLRQEHAAQLQETQQELDRRQRWYDEMRSRALKAEEEKHNLSWRHVLVSGLVGGGCLMVGAGLWFVLGAASGHDSEHKGQLVAGLDRADTTVTRLSSTT
jgi:hypothetical protein